MRIACPRQNCKRIINLAESRSGHANNGQSSVSSQVDNRRPTNMTPGGVPSSPGMCRVTCGHCFDSFLFDTLRNQLARCPFCRKLSSVGPEFARGRGIVHMILFLIMLGAALGTTLGTKQYLHEYKALIALDVILFVFAAYFLIRSIYYLSIKVSTIELSS